MGNFTTKLFAKIVAAENSIVGSLFPQGNNVNKLGMGKWWEGKPDNTAISLKNRNTRKILLMFVIYLESRFTSW